MENSEKKYKIDFSGTEREFNNAVEKFDNFIKQYEVGLNQAIVVYSYYHKESSEKVSIEDFRHDGDRFWRLKVDGLTMGYWNTEDSTLDEVIQYADSVIGAVIQFKEELTSRYDSVIEEFEEKGYIRFIDKEYEKVVEIDNLYGGLFTISINDIVTLRENEFGGSLDSELLHNIIMNSDRSQRELFKKVADWLDKYASDMKVKANGEEFGLASLFKKNLKKISNIDIYQLSHLIDGLNQTKRLAYPEYFASKVVEILSELGVISQLTRLEMIKRNTVDSVLNRALNGDNTKGV